MAAKRLNKELLDLQNAGNARPGWSDTGPVGDNIFHWAATVAGPSASPYAGSTFEVSINFPQSYPFKPPKVSFVTKIYHINVSAKDGTIIYPFFAPKIKTDVQQLPTTEDHDSGVCSCEGLMQYWVPVRRAADLLDEVCAMLGCPDPAVPCCDPVDANRRRQYSTRYEEYEKEARQWTVDHAMPAAGVEECEPCE